MVQKVVRLNCESEECLTSPLQEKNFETIIMAVKADNAWEYLPSMLFAP